MVRSVKKVSIQNHQIIPAPVKNLAKIEESETINFTLTESEHSVTELAQEATETVVIAETQDILNELGIAVNTANMEASNRAKAIQLEVGSNQQQDVELKVEAEMTYLEMIELMWEKTVFLQVI